MEYLLTGDIKSSTYDKIVDLDRVEFTDKKNKVDVYLEYPRLEGVTSLSNVKTVSLEITDDYDKSATEETLMVLNTTLYMVRTEDKKNIVQFSSGGIVLRLIAEKKNLDLYTYKYLKKKRMEVDN